MHVLEWGLREFLARRKMGAADLAELFESIGFSYSLSACYRLIDAERPRLTWDVLEALTTALDCAVADLIVKPLPPPRSPGLTMPPPVKLLEERRGR